MQTWEYNFVVFKLEPGMSVKEVIRLDQLNAAGADGWEMVNVMPLGQSFLMYTFKRPKGEAAAARNQKQGAAAVQPRSTVQKAKPRALNEISLEPKPQAQPQPEPQAGINVMDILNSILGGGDGSN